MAELRATLDHRELIAWMAYDRLAPFGPEAEDYRTALALSQQANIHRSKKQKLFRVGDFALGRLLQRSREDSQREDRATIAARVRLALGMKSGGAG